MYAQIQLQNCVELQVHKKTKDSIAYQPKFPRTNETVCYSYVFLGTRSSDSTAKQSKQLFRSIHNNYTSYIKLQGIIKQLEHQEIWNGNNREISESDKFEKVNKEHPHLFKNHVYSLLGLFEETIKLLLLQTVKDFKFDVPEL
ncbi:unnamed protein product [Paramecium octaurelia]|uniref:Uncharacterized protein n=1 Tax=Paramecium octaurelia TaxID=43137 RepID=A0A8S1Y5H9_PAROT|nr:unnamed protein product [Paramecium octaurelia]CAD8208381.1 unnamed protein product [Paramecium octaurelia]